MSTGRNTYGKEFGQTNTIRVPQIAELRIARIGDNSSLSEEVIAEIGG